MINHCDHVPYVYLIGWTSRDLWYLGCELKNGASGTAHPSNLWLRYFTSSYHVGKAREKYGEPDVVQVRMTFDSSKDAHAWEQKALRRLGAVSSPRWLNKRIFDDKSFSMDEDIRAKIIETRRKSGKPWHSEEAGRSISEAKKGVPVSYSPAVLKAFGDRLRDLNADNDFQAKRNEGCRRRWSDDQQVKDQAERMIRSTHTVEARSKAMKTRMTPEFKADEAERARLAWPQRADRMKAGREAWWSDPANRLAHAQKMATVRKGKAVIANGVTYASARECADAHGRTASWVYDNVARGRFAFKSSD